ncbi:MAG: hypothetical protein Pg6A_03210 [Termitinemataceae bacterium]|nr:MAG: hypothetical protein Pg6A_03210 [Termitinemataceae bacterium]
MKKSFVVVSVFAMFSLLFAACSRSKKPDKPVFMLCISHMTNAFTKTVADSMSAAAASAGAELIINEAGNDIGKQVGQIESGVNQKVNAIIVEPVNVSGVIPAIEAAEKAGVPVIVFNQRISDGSKAHAFVGVSNETLGFMEMKSAAEAIGGSGNIAILLGPLGSDGQLGRSAGYEKALAEYPDIKVAFQETGNWTAEEGLKLAENWLQTGQTLAAIVSQNDGMALGAVKAVEDKGLSGTVKVYGLDAVPDALKAVQAGRLTATVSQATERQSQKAIEVAMALYNKQDVPAENLVEGAVIDKNNVSEFINP